MDIVVVRVLSGERFIGTAFFINENTLITAKHVAKRVIIEEQPIYLSEMPNKGRISISQNSIKMCNEVDIAIINLDIKSKITSLNYSTELDIGLEVMIYGYKNLHGAINKQPKYISGFTNNKDNIFECSGYIAPGYSGSPVLINNKLYGVAISRSKEENITYIIPISKVCFSLPIKQININELKSSHVQKINNLVDKYRFSIILSRRYVNIEHYQKTVASTLSKREDFIVKILKIEVTTHLPN